ncbi:MAG: sulfite exporter TauE/SafE family protein [Chloroflexi bacterium]|nr:sulfite exporter TauE/SafE family protein [Chloroflexota bacterium]
MSIVTAIAALLVGISIGYVGIGGIFLIPVLIAAEGLPVQVAIGTALATFFFTGLGGTITYARQRRIPWGLALLTSAASLPFGPLGAKVSVSLPAPVVQAAFALFLMISGAIAFARAIGWFPSLRRPPIAHPVSTGRAAAAELAAPLPMPIVLACGAIAGFAAGLLGVGGPAVLVPLLLLLGVPAAAAVAASQVNQIAASLAGGAGHFVFGELYLGLVLAVATAEVIGVWLGAHLSRRTSPQALQPVAAAACFVVAGWTMWRLIVR